MDETHSTNLPAHANLVGQRFGRWTVLSKEMIRKGRTYWDCICECGTRSIVDGKELRLGRSTSCIRCRNRSHGMSGYPEYFVWKMMRRRCTDIRYKDYHHYGGRGITICEAWQSFQAFYRDMGPRPTPTHTIERIDNNLGYCKENCHWATRKEQANNTRHNHLLTFNGVTQSISNWADELHLTRSALWYRITSGWSVERALTTPLRTRE